MNAQEQEKMIEAIGQGKEYFLFLSDKGIRKLPVAIELHEHAMEVEAERRLRFWFEYQRMKKPACERIFKLQILTFTYEQYRVALQIR